MNIRMAGPRLTVLFAALVFSAGCEGVVGLDGRAQIDTGVEGMASGPVPDVENEPAAEPNSPSGSMNDGTGATGTVDVRARILVQAAGGEWREITEGSVDQRVRIDGTDGLKLLSRMAVEADEYVRVRVEFERVEADVTGGLWIGLDSLTGKVEVDAGGDGTVAVERDIRFTARANARTRIRIALNAREWLERSSANPQLVSEAAFVGAVGIAVE